MDPIIHELTLSVAELQKAVTKLEFELAQLRDETAATFKKAGLPGPEESVTDGLAKALAEEKHLADIVKKRPNWLRKPTELPSTGLPPLTSNEWDG